MANPIALRPIQKPESIVMYYALCHSIFTLLVGSFEAIMVIKLTGSLSSYIALNIVMYVLLFVFFTLGLFTARSGKITRNFKLDLAIQALLGALVIVLFTNLGSFLSLALIFLLKGMSEGLFWSTRHIAIIATTNDDSRDSWMLKLQSFTIVLSIVLPLISALVISYVKIPASFVNDLLDNGYVPVYATASALALLGLMFGPSAKVAAQKLEFKRLKLLIADKTIRSYLAYLMFASVGGALVPTMVNYLNFVVLKTEFNIGVFASLISLLSAVFFIIMRFIFNKRPLPRSNMILVGAFGESASRVIFYFFLSLPGLVVKSIIDTFVVPLKGLFGENLVRAKVEDLSNKHQVSILEVLLFQEITVFVGRIMVLGLVLLSLVVLGSSLGQGLGLDESFAKAILLICMFFGFIDYLLLRKVQKTLDVAK